MKHLIMSLSSFCLSLWLAVSVCLPALAFDYPDEQPTVQQPVNATMGPGGAVQFGWYWPKLGAFNDELRSMGMPAVGGSFCVGGTLRYALDEHWQIGYTGGGWGLSSSAIVNNQVKEVTLGFSFHNLGVFYKFYPWPQLTTTLGAGLGYYSVNYKKSITGGPYQYGDGQTPANAPTSVANLTGSAWGGELMAGLSYALNPIISLGTEICYLKSYIGTLNQAGQVMAAAPPIDLGGWLIRIGPQINL